MQVRTRAVLSDGSGGTMKRTVALPAKLVRPTQAGAYRRARLFALLDRARPVAWVSGPPGAGKTTLVASYVEARRLRPLWYQVDERDGDLATVFYYLRQAAVRAAPRKRWRLPPLTPEYVAGVGAFTRRWFEELFAGLPQPIALVFDNYQEAGAASGLHDLLRCALETLPPKGRVVLISRGDPPAQLARLRAAGDLVRVGWEALRLTAEETRGIARAKTRRAIPPRDLRALHAATDGWTAGLVLMLERVAGRIGRVATAGERPLQAVFDYFASEILARSDSRTRRVLLECALLSKVTARQAESLTGVPQAGKILGELAQRRYFTDSYPDPEPSYQYHPLFREFLLARGREQLSVERRMELRRKAAAILEESYQIDDAAEQLRQAEDWEGLARLASGHAPALLAQGRAPTLAEWLGSLPAAVLDRHPWLLVWSGACAIGVDPDTSHLRFVRAFALFSERGDRVGALVSWAGAVDAIVLQFADAHRLDPWLERVETTVEPFLAEAPPEVAFRVAASVCSALIFRAPFVAELRPWLQRAERLVADDSDVTRRILTAYYLGIHAVWTGDLVRATAVRERARELAASTGVSPLAKIVSLYVEAHASWLSGELARSREAVESALQIANSTGVHLMDAQLVAIGLYSALSAGDAIASAQLLERMAKGLHPARVLDVSHHRYVAAWHARLRGDLNAALRLAGEALAQTLAAGVPFPSALCHHAMALTSHERGDVEGARAHLAEAWTIARRMESRILECSCHLAKAEFAHAAGEADGGRDALAAGLAIARSEGYGNVHWWRQDAMSALCARALKDGIESEYVVRLIRLRGLQPPAAETPEAWPWPVRVYALGGFEVQVDGKPVVFASKAQRKPLALLKALVALGGRAVREQEIADALWPEAEGDAAHQALAVTLHRLRRLLRDDAAIHRQEGRLELDPRRVWSDVAALDVALHRAAHAPPDVRARLVDGALQLYRGPLLTGDEDEPWTAAPRDRLRARVVRELQEVARAFEASGDADRAASCYLKALDVDDRAENLYRQLIALYQRLGRRAEALATYQRCQTTLRVAVGVAPSPETEAIVRALYIAD